MFSLHDFTFFTIAIYFLASCAGICGMLFRNANLRKAGSYLSILAFLCQTLALILGLHKNLSGTLSIGAYLQMAAWFILLCGIGAWWRLREESLILFASPFGLILFLMSAKVLDVQVPLPSYLSSSFYALHIGALYLSLGLIFLAFMSGSIFLLLEKRLKGKKNLKGLWQDMPSLFLLDNINNTCALITFPLYTLGILAGLYWSGTVYGRVLSGDPKEYISLLVWVLLATLFHNRLAKNWKGRKPAILSITIFILSILSIFVVNFIFQSHHTFIRH